MAVDTRTGPSRDQTTKFQFAPGRHPTPPGVRPIGPILVPARHARAVPATWNDIAYTRTPQTVQSLQHGPARYVQPLVTPTHPIAARTVTPPRPVPSFADRVEEEHGPMVTVASVLADGGHLPDWTTTAYGTDLVRQRTLWTPDTSPIIQRVKSGATTAALVTVFTVGGLTIGNRSGVWQAVPDGTALAWGQPVSGIGIQPGDEILVRGDTSTIYTVILDDTGAGKALTAPDGTIRPIPADGLFRLEHRVPFLGAFLSSTAAKAVVAVAAAAATSWVMKLITQA